MPGTVLTSNGRNLLAKALTGKTLKFTKAYIGDGKTDAADWTGFTKLINPVVELPIVQLSTSPVGTADIKCKYDNTSRPTGFDIREYGLFALDPDTGDELLYCYVNKGEKCSYLEGYDGTNPVQHEFHIITVIDQATNVTANITVEDNSVSKSDLLAAIASLFGTTGVIEGFFYYVKDDEHVLRTATLAEVRKAIIGTADIASYDRRITALENAQNVTNLRLDLLDDSGTTPACFMAEDFADPDTVDLFSAKITSIVTGDDSIDCAPENGLLPGSFYTVSDGTQSELVQVESVSLENGIARVILYETIQNTYNLEACTISRTTASVQAGNAYGSAMPRAVTWLPLLTWKGLADNAEYSVPLDTSISRADAFTFSGNAVINSDGAFSLGR